jgi:hypothetical protein
MFRLVRFLAIAVGCIAGGCSIHPVPENVTRVSTYHIVRQIRCETREAIRWAIIDWLDDLAKHGDVIAQQLVLQYKSDPESIAEFRADLFPGPEFEQRRHAINVFADAGIAYNFDLMMTEENDLSTNIDFLRPLLRPSLKLGITAGGGWQRSNDRTFTVTDRFDHLITKLNSIDRGVRYCDQSIVQANYVYPIAGRIGVDRLVRDFIELTLFGNLAEKTATNGVTGAPTMSDKLVFTTTINASANPGVVFAPVGHALQLMDASLMATAKRSDVHTVTVALAISPTGLKNLTPLETYLFPGARVAGTAKQQGVPAGAPVLVARRLTGISRSPSEDLAILAIDQILVRELQLVPSPLPPP